MAWLEEISMHRCLAVCILILLAAPALADDADAWIDLVGPGQKLDVWKNPGDGWEFAGAVSLDPANPRRLVATPGNGILVNGPKGRAHDLISGQTFGDIEVHVEFMIPKGSNSGVKFEGLYEIQIEDSWGKKELTGDDCGGVYPRATLRPRYKHLDKGVPPRTNACRPAGEWQTLDAVFRAPRFDAAGKKTANARLVKAVLNGKLIHEQVELKTPTGHLWTQPEIARGPLLLQGDHGPIAFRNVRVRPYKND
jgi:hypothetical protein